MRIVPNDESDVQTATTNDGQMAQSARSNGPPSLRVVRAIAEAIDDDATTMEPLYETVDTDALDRLLELDTSLEIVFEYEGHAIEARSDGVVTVDGNEVRASDRP